MKKILLMLCAFTTMLLACAAKKEEPQANQPQSAPKSSLKIGEYGSLTGATATFGQSTHEGILLALEEQNQDGGLLGKKIELITEDNQSRIDEAKTTVIKLIKQDRVVALLGEVASSRSLVAAPECQNSKVPMLTPASTNPEVTKAGDYIFRSCFTDDFQGRGMAKYVFEKLNFKKVAILKDIKSDYSVGLSEYFEKAFKSLGGEIVGVEAYSEGDSDFRTQLTELKTRTPDALYVPGYYTEVGLIARQAREMNLQAPLLGSDGWDSPKTIEFGGKAVEGALFTSHYASDDPNPVVQGFIQKYQKKYGKTPDVFAALGYDAARVLFDAIRRANSDEPTKIRDALAKTEKFKGITGEITLNAERNAQKPLFVLKIEAGKTKLIDTIWP